MTKISLIENQQPNFIDFEGGCHKKNDSFGLTW